MKAARTITDNVEDMEISLYFHHAVELAKIFKYTKVQGEYG